MRKVGVGQRKRVSISQHRARHWVLSTAFTRSTFGIPTCYRFGEKPRAFRGFSFRVKHASPFHFVVYLNFGQSPRHNVVLALTIYPL